MKKLVSLVLALAMLLSMAVAASAETASPFTAENPGKLTVAVYDRSNTTDEYGTVTDNYWTNWVNEQMMAEYNIEVEYVAVPRSGAETTFNTMLAGGTAPDIIFYYSTDRVFDFANQGGLADLTADIETYGADITALAGHLMDYAKFDGMQVAVPAVRGGLGHLCSMIRKDWLDKIGYELKVDEDGVGYISYTDLEYILTEWKKQGIAEYPMALGSSSSSEAESLSPFYMAFVDHANLTEEHQATLPTAMWPGVQDGFAWLNKLYNAGLIQPDWAQYTDETQYNNWIANGDVGVWAHAYWQNLSETGAIGTLMTTNPEAEVVPFCLTNDEGTAALIDQYAPYGMFIVVPAYSEHVTEAVIFLNWQSKYENYETLAFGIEGEHYTRNEDGTYNTITKEQNPDQKLRQTTGDMVLVSNGNPNKEIYEASLIGKTWPEWLQKAYWSAYKASMVNTYIPFLFDTVIVSSGEYSTALNEKLQELRVKTITGAEADFEATWTTIIDEYKAMGGQTVIDEKVAAYAAMQAK